MVCVGFFFFLNHWILFLDVLVLCYSHGKMDVATLLEAGFASRLWQHPAYHEWVIPPRNNFRNSGGFFTPGWFLVECYDLGLLSCVCIFVHLFAKIQK